MIANRLPWSIAKRRSHFRVGFPARVCCFSATVGAPQRRQVRLRIDPRAERAEKHGRSRGPLANDQKQARPRLAKSSVPMKPELFAFPGPRQLFAPVRSVRWASPACATAQPPPAEAARVSPIFGSGGVYGCRSATNYAYRIPRLGHEAEKSRRAVQPAASGGSSKP